MEHISTCTVCQQAKPSPDNTQPLTPIHVTELFELVTIDIIGPILPASGRGNKYILVMADHWTNYVEIESMQTKTAAEVAKWLFAYICRHSCPIRILTDQGKCFEAELFKELLALLDIDKSRTTPYHPQCDGQTERFNRTLEAILICFIQDNLEDWDEFLKQLAFAYNTTVHATTGVSPFQMVYGRLPRLPIDYRESETARRTEDQSLRDQVDEIIEMLGTESDEEQVPGLDLKWEEVPQFAVEETAKNDQEYQPNYYFKKKWADTPQEKSPRLKRNR